MTYRLPVIPLVIVFLCWCALAIYGNSLYFRMLDRVNRELPLDNQIPALGPAGLQTPKVLRLHQEHFPASRDPIIFRRLRWLILLGPLVFLAVVKFGSS